jgi:hypothetical protein
MATLHSITNSNLSSASWALVNPASYLDSRAASTTLTTSAVASSTFIPGAITLQGVSIQILGRTATPTGTITLQLFNSTTSTIITSVVLNVSDLPNTTFLSTPYIGWTYFKFASNQLLVAGNSYSIRLLTSSTNQVQVYRDATANNWNRALVTTTTLSAITGDNLIIGGSYSSAGVNSTTTITMDGTSLVTQYGTIYVGSNGVFNYGIAASTNYALKLAGDFWIGRGGTFTIGTVANPIPATSTAILEFNCASALQYQFYNFGTFETKYATTVLNRALLNADIAIGATTMTTDVSTGWKINDVIVIPSTTRTSSQFERVTLNANASGTTLTHNATSFAHDGNAAIYIQADLANLTRSIKIRSTNGNFKSRFQQGINGVTTIFDVEFYEWVGCIHNSGTGTYAGSFNLQQSTFWQTTLPGTETVINNLNTTTNTISNNVFYNYSSGTQNIDDNNLIIGFIGFQAWFGAIGNNNVLSSCMGSGLSGVKNGSTGNRIYANSSGGNGGIYFVSTTGGYTISNWSFFNNVIAIRFGQGMSTQGVDRTPIEKFENCYFYGNQITMDVLVAGQRRLWFNNCYFWGGKTGLITAVGYTAMWNDITHFSNCTFGRRPDGVDSFFSTSCLRGVMFGNTLTNCLFYGTQLSFGAATSFSTVNGFQGLISLKHNGVTNDYRLVQNNGYAQPDSVITYNGNSTIRILPQIATNKTFSNPVRVAVVAGATCTITLAVRKSVLADGTAYNGNQPRLMYAFNPLAGNLAETVAATATIASNGAWEVLSYTTSAVSNDGVLEFYLDCDGTTGWVNISDFRTTTSNDTRPMNFWSTVGVYSEPDWRKPGGSYGFVN